MEADVVLLVLGKGSVPLESGTQHGRDALPAALLMLVCHSDMAATQTGPAIKA